MLGLSDNAKITEEHRCTRGTWKTVSLRTALNHIVFKKSRGRRGWKTRNHPGITLDFLGRVSHEGWDTVEVEAENRRVTSPTLTLCVNDGIAKTLHQPINS
jgi:hypothetical protein